MRYAIIVFCLFYTGCLIAKDSNQVIGDKAESLLITTLEESYNQRLMVAYYHWMGIEGRRKDPYKAIMIWSELGQQNDFPAVRDKAFIALGIISMGPDVLKNYEYAYNFFSAVQNSSCPLVQMTAYLNLGLMHIHGQCPESDHEIGCEYLRYALQNHPEEDGRDAARRALEISQE